MPSELILAPLPSLERAKPSRTVIGWQQSSNGLECLAYSNGRFLFLARITADEEAVRALFL